MYYEKSQLNRLHSRGYIIRSEDQTYRRNPIHVSSSNVLPVVQRATDRWCHGAKRGLSVKQAAAALAILDLTPLTANTEFLK